MNRVGADEAAVCRPPVYPWSVERSLQVHRICLPSVARVVIRATDLGFECLARGLAIVPEQQDQPHPQINALPTHSTSSAPGGVRAQLRLDSGTK